MIRIFVSFLVSCEVYGKPFLANSSFEAHSSTPVYNSTQCNNCIYDGDNSPLVQYTVDPTKAPLSDNDTYIRNKKEEIVSNRDNKGYGYATVTADVKNITKGANNATVAQLIDLLRVFRVVQLKQLQRYLSESLKNAQYEGSRADYNAADRFHSEHRDVSLLRNKSVVAIEEIFKAMVSNNSIQKLWCDKQQRELKGENCSLVELWKLFNMTLSEAPRHKTSYFVKPGDFASVPVLSKATTQPSPAAPLNETLAGNITVELTVRMDGHKIGNVEMAKSYYENGGKSSNISRENSSLQSLLPKPYKLIIYNDLTEASIKADSASGEYNVEHDAAHQNDNSSAKPLTQSESHATTEGEPEKEKEWSDTNIDEHNKTSNPIFNELLELDPGLLSENLFDEEASGWDFDALHINASKPANNNSSNSTSVIILPEPPQSNHSSNSSTHLNEIEDKNNNQSKGNSSTYSDEKDGDSYVNLNNSKKQNTPTNSLVKKALEAGDSSDLYVRNSRPTAENDENEFIATLAQLFKLLLSNKTLQDIKQASSFLGDGNLRNRYYTDVIDLLKLLKQTLNQLELPHDNGTEELLITTLKQLMKMITFIDASLVSLSQTEDKEDARTFSSRSLKTNSSSRSLKTNSSNRSLKTNYSSRSLKTNSSFSKILAYQNLIRSHQSAKLTPQRAMAYGDLGDVKNGTENQSKTVGVSVDELKQLLPLL